MLDPLADGSVASVAVDLRPAGNARAYLVLDHVTGYLLLELLHEKWALRARPHKAHIPFQHIEDLWKLIKACLADEFPDRGDTRIIPGRPSLLLMAVILYFHGAELIHLKFLVMQPHPYLGKNQRPLGGKLDQEGDKEHRDGENEQHQHRARDIHRALEELVHGIAERDIADVDDREPIQILGVGCGGDHVLVIRHELCVDTGFLANGHEPFKLIIFVQPQCDRNLVKKMILQDLAEHGSLAQYLDPPVACPVLHMIVQDPIHMVAPIQVGLDAVDIALRRAAVTDHQDMLLVEALAPQVIEYLREEVPEQQAEHGIRQEKDKNEGTGNVRFL